MIDLFAIPDHEDRQVCAETAACVVCALSPLDGESRADWLARLRDEVKRQDSDEPDVCAQGHPWLPETTRWESATRRLCLICQREANRQYRAKLRAARIAS